MLSLLRGWVCLRGVLHCGAALLILAAAALEQSESNRNMCCPKCLKTDENPGPAGLTVLLSTSVGSRPYSFISKDVRLGAKSIFDSLD